MLMLILAGTAAFAAESAELDMNRTGSVHITMNDAVSGLAVGGGSLTMYQVADVTWTNEGPSYIYTAEFEKCDIDLGDLSDTSLSENLGIYVAENAIRGTTIGIADDGMADFSELALGLYLFVQDEAADGYQAISSFLISVPMDVNGSWVYDVDATPKMERLTASSAESEEKTGTSSTPSGDTVVVNTGSSVADSTLPQTGMLLAPIAALAIVGVLLFAIGWRLVNTRERKYAA